MDPNYSLLIELQAKWRYYDDANMTPNDVMEKVKMAFPVIPGKKGVIVIDFPSESNPDASQQFPWSHTVVKTSLKDRETIDSFCDFITKWIYDMLMGNFTIPTIITIKAGVIENDKEV